MMLDLCLPHRLEQAIALFVSFLLLVCIKESVYLSPIGTLGEDMCDHVNEIRSTGYL